MQQMMVRIVLACASFSLGILASPAAAQQTAPGVQSSPTQAQPAGSLSQETQPAPAPEAAPLPPPFPPMPRSRPSHRWVDVGGHHVRRNQHHSARAHHHPARASHRRSHGLGARASASPRMVSRCHRMSYTQIMQHGSCRALMREELASSSHRHREHSRRHRATTHRAHVVRRHHHSRRHAR